MARSTSLDDPALVAAHELGDRQEDIVSRRQLYAVGIGRWLVRREVLHRRWQLMGDQSVCLHNGPIGPSSHRWAAVFQGGPRAQLDGASALVASGLERFTEEKVRVSVPRGARIRRTATYDIRQTRRWSSSDAVTTGLPRTRPAVAAVRAALWARTEREATYVLTAAVQQGLVSAPDLGREALRIRRDRRRALLHEVVDELLGGARSLGEIDVVRQLRARGLPAPRRQVLRRDGRNRYYLDLYWPDYGLVVEIDGIHHAWVERVVDDALRQNALVIDGDRVLRIPLLGLRLQPDRFFAQIEQALLAGGWRVAA